MIAWGTALGIQLHTSLWLLSLSLLLAQAIHEPSAITEPNLAFTRQVTHCTISGFRQTVQSHQGLWLLLFYSPWCPSCRTIAPEWSATARGFSKVGSYFANVMVGAVNCASEPALRKQFRVTQTPTALALRVSKRGTLNVLDATVIREADGYVELIKWAGQVMRQSRYFRAQGDRIDQVLVAARALAQHDPLPALSKTRMQQMTPTQHQLQQVVQAAAWISLDPFHVMDESNQLIGERHAALQDWVELLKIIGAVPRHIMIENGVNTSSWKQMVVGLRKAHLSWAHCSGTGHGYPCALWQLLHVVTSTVQTVTAARVLSTFRQYIQHFFLCAPCSRHFVAAADRATDNISTRQELVLWVWKVIA